MADSALWEKIVAQFVRDGRFVVLDIELPSLYLFSCAESKSRIEMDIPGM